MARKIQSSISAERARQHIASRFNPVSGNGPEYLGTVLDNFDRGYLRDAAFLWQKIRERDDVAQPVADKRELAVSLLDYEILTEDESPAAAKHKAALEAFYSTLRVRHALEGNQVGGVPLLIRQMMSAQGYRYGVHEIVWDPSRKDLAAEFIFTPLQFFENRTGRLRFLPTDYAVDGMDLEDGGWLVTVGAGLMIATSIAYLFKQLPLRDWLIFCEKAGIPGLHGQTDAKKGSPEWNEFRDALANFGVDWAMVTSVNGKVTPIDLKASGQLPHPPLVDRMDRAIARIWRGGDLGTMSKDGSAVGSNPQEDETAIFEAADAALISETLWHGVDRYVIRYRFGEEPKAYFKLQPRKRLNVAQELLVDQALIAWGVPISWRDLRQRYNRSEPKAGEELARPTAPSQPPLANEAYPPQALREARAQTLQPLAARLQEIQSAGSDAAQALIARLRADLPKLAPQLIADPRYAAAIEELLRAAAQTTEAPKNA